MSLSILLDGCYHLLKYSPRLPSWKKNVNQRWRYKSELKIELKSNFTFKWFANVDVKFGMNVVNDHSCEGYTPADH